MLVHGSGYFSSLAMASRSPFVDNLLFHEVVITNIVSSHLLVHEFDLAKFADKCLPSSPNYGKDLAKDDVLCAGIFNAGNVWKSSDLLASVLKVIPKQYGCKSQLNNTRIRCNRFGKP